MGNYLVSVLASAAGVILFVSLAYGYCKKNARDSFAQRVHVLWAPALFVAFQLFIALWASLGLLSAGVVSQLLYHGVCIAGIFIAFYRRRAARALLNIDFSARVAICILRDIVLICLATIVSFVGLEVLWNDLLGDLFISYALLELVIIALVVVTLYFVFARTGFGVALATLFFVFVGIAQFYVVEFKGSPIMPSDLLTLGTAAEVADGYDFVVDGRTLRLLAALVFVILLSVFMIPAKSSSKRGATINVVVNVSLALALGASTATGLTVVDFSEAFSTDKICWVPLVFYKYQGFIPTFVTLAQNQEIEQPEEYTPEEADDLESQFAASYDASRGSAQPRKDAVAQFEEIKPTVVAIMNESYSDLSIYGNLGGNYEGAAFPRILDDALVSGSVYSSVLGGGTANSEFEFFSCSTLGYVGPAKNAYTLYDLSNAYGLPRAFAELGYKTTAIHPQDPTNYNRDLRYKELGFDTFISQGDFVEAPVFHNGVSDGATYDKVLELLRKDQSPQFIFDLTMQNHGGYATGNLPAGYAPDYYIDGVGEDLRVQLNEFVGCINKSDEDLAAFLDELRQMDRPVVVVFFGDHQPGFGPALNDVMCSDDNELAHTQRSHSTPYFIWANYDVAGNDQVSEQREMGINTLGSTLMEVIGAPLTSYQKASLAIQEQISCINVNGYRGNDGVWYEFDDTSSPFAALVDESRRIQYLEFATKVQ